MKQVRKKAALWTVAGILFVALCAVMFAVLYREHQIKITPVANDGLTVEAGIDALPQASEYFSYLGAFDETSAELRYTPTGQSDAFTAKSLSEGGDNSAVATSLGTYTVTITCDGFTDEFTSSLTVVDTTVPALALKDVSIEYGGSYTVHDFVESCTDNSDTECRIAFATADSSGNATDFSNLTDSGTHTVVLTATDPSGNQATAEAKLIIGEKPQPKPEPKPEPQPEPKPAVVDLPYSIEINRQQNVVTIYTKDTDGQYTVPYKAFVCSTGGSNTPTGNFKLGARYEWLTLVGGVQGQYTTRIHGSIAFHSVPYFTRNKADLEYEEYNKLGTVASLGCVRMAVQDVKWVYENCAAGTPVKIFDSDEIGPLGKPTPIYIDPESPNRGWDPTDPDPANPWRQQG